LTETSGKEFKREIDWNFEKFLINRSGKLVARFKSSVDPLNKELQGRIQDLLKEKVK
jgi:glutathione peroxidase